jgi:transcriptional regulator with XRE-family HTH domain
VKFGERLRELRKGQGLTLRSLAEAVGVDFTYLSKIENDKAGYLPGADTIRALAAELEADALELLELADKVPPEMEGIASDVHARRFLQRAKEVASPDDWVALLDMLDKRQKDRKRSK